MVIWYEGFELGGVEGWECIWRIREFQSIVRCCCMRINDIVWTIIAGEKLSGSFFSFFLVLLTAMQCRQHHFFADHIGYFGGPVQVSVMCLKNFCL